MIDVHFVILGAVCALVGAVLYAWDTVRGVTHPNRVTWFLWGAIPMVAFAAEVHASVGLRSLMTLAIGIGPLVVFGASFVNRSAVWHIGALDYTCGALSLVGVAVWLTTEQGVVAIGASIAADALAAFPTMRKAWLAPHTESAIAYAGGLASGVLTLLTVQVVTIAEVAFPIYIVVMTSLELILIVGKPGPRLRAIRVRSVREDFTQKASTSGESPEMEASRQASSSA